MHQAQAAMFAASFGGEKSAVEVPHSQSGVAGTAPANRPKITYDGSDEFAQRLRFGMDILRRWAESQPAPRSRWPQLAFYFLRDELYVRDYYEAVPWPNNRGSDDDPSAEGPNEEGSFASPRYDITDEATRLALAPDGIVYRRLRELFGEREVALRRREIQLISVDFRFHDNTIVICEARGDKTRVSLATFHAQGEAFVLSEAE